MKYRIKWKSKETGYEGQGEPVFNTKEMAEKTVARLNAQHKDVLHWIEAVDSDEQE